MFYVLKKYEFCGEMREAIQIQLVRQIFQELRSLLAQELHLDIFGQKAISGSEIR
jgi:hypothetical protein